MHRAPASSIRECAVTVQDTIEDLPSKAEYRRGLASERANELWHWHPDCMSYPRNAYEIRKGRPSTDYLCARCSRLIEDMRARPTA